MKTILRNEFSGWLFGKKEGNHFILLGTGTSETVTKLLVQCNAGISRLTT